MRKEREYRFKLARLRVVIMEFVNRNFYRNNIGIYQIKNLVNSDIYIGQTEQNFLKRYWHHQWQLRRGIHENYPLQSAWEEFGENNFEFSVVHVLEAGEDINTIERNFISMYKKLGSVYN